jgi:hypothetical protein
LFALPWDLIVGFQVNGLLYGFDISVASFGIFVRLAPMLLQQGGVDFGNVGTVGL